MIQTVQNILKQQHILFHLNQGVTVATVANLHEGFGLIKDILYSMSDPKTALYLSGGSTPKVLYEKLAEEEKLSAGAVGLVDERFGKPFHDKSNEKMIRETGLLRYLQMRDIPFYPILQFPHPNPLPQGEGILLSSSPSQGEDRGEGENERKRTAQVYDEKFRTLNARYQKSIAILGIGPDGHTSSLAPNRPDFENPMFADANKHLLVSEFNDPNSFYGERVGMTFLGLSMQDLLIILAFGEEKKKPLELMFSEGSEQQIPARFFTRPEIAKKTILITDQQI